MDVFGKNPVVDFDYFHFENMGFNYDLAKELAIILIDYADIDELKGIYNDVERFNSSIGTGGSGSNYACPSLASQRACLAGHFASYANRKYESCFLSKFEYQCLVDLLNYLEEDCFPPQHRAHIHDRQIEILKMVIDKFKREYHKVDKEFFLELL